jgi:HAD superfamily hydrolase (TIGR01509 family)
MYKAIFFDLDETLVDAMTCHIEATAKTFEAYNVSYLEVHEKTKQYDFLGQRMIDIHKIMRDATGLTEKEIPLQQFSVVRERLFLELVSEKATLLPGARVAVQQSKKNGKVVAITSSGTRAYILFVLQKFDLTSSIDYIVGEEDVQRGKPFPDVYEKAYTLLPQHLYLKKKECLVVEDSVAGVKAAQAAGLPVVFVPKYPPKETVISEYTITSLLEFPWKAI